MPYTLEEDAKDYTVKKINDLEGNWLVCIFKVSDIQPDGSRRNELETTTWQFPNEVISSCVQLLHKHLTEQVAPPEPTPLQIADFLNKVKIVKKEDIKGKE